MLIGSEGVWLRWSRQLKRQARYPQRPDRPFIDNRMSEQRRNIAPVSLFADMMAGRNGLGRVSIV